MTPTPEQLAQWAREEGMESVPYRYAEGCLYLNVSDDELHRLVTRAMAEQAEADAKLCDRFPQLDENGKRLMPPPPPLEDALL